MGNVSVRFRYSDLQEADRGCGGLGPYANSIVESSGVLVRRNCSAERNTKHGVARGWLVRKSVIRST